jgi:T5SS/PEP-CTERM-associated repeat protein
VDNASFKAAQFAVGEGGPGTLAIRNGGSVSTQYTLVAQFTGSSGSVDVDGAGSTLDNTGGLNVGGYGRGEVTVRNGGIIRNGTDLNIADQSGHGVVRLAGPDSQIINGGSLTVGLGSATGAAGELDLASGASVTSLQRILLSDTSRLSFTGDGNGAGLISATSDATLGGVLSFEFADGFHPPAGTTYDIITASGISGRFTQFLSDEPVRLIYGPQSVSIQVIPEPTGVALIALAVVGLAGRRQCGRSKSV